MWEPSKPTEPTKPTKPAVEKQPSGIRQGGKDWSADIQLLEIRLRELRRSAAAAPHIARGGQKDARQPAPQPSASMSLAESLAYAQAAPVRQQRPLRPARRGWRPEAYKATLGSELMPDAGWKNREQDGQS